MNNNVIIHSSAIISEKNEKSTANHNNINTFKQRSVNFTESLIKIMNELKNRYKINDDPKAVKEFEAFYTNMLDKIHSLRNANPSNNNNAYNNNNNQQSQNSLNNQTQENSSLNVYFLLIFYLNI